MRGHPVSTLAMSGIRLHHPTLRAGEGTTLTYVVELPQPYPKPYNCPTCEKPHAQKAIHLRLDGNGDVIVSTQVFASLKTAFLGGMVVANEVEKPPSLRIGAVAKDKERIVEAPLSGLVPAEVITPERTKYQNRDRMRRLFLPRRRD